MSLLVAEHESLFGAAMFTLVGEKRGRERERGSKNESTDLDRQKEQRTEDGKCNVGQSFLR